MRIIYLAFFGLFISGCASWKANYDFCKKTNWRELGMRDGKNDKKMEETFAQYKMMCKEFDEDLQPDLTLYRHGHFASIKQLCTYDKGREYGLNRKKTSNNCSKKKHPKFYQGIKDGVDEYCNFDNGILRAKDGWNTSIVCERELEKHADFFKGMKKGLVSYCKYNYGHNVGLKTEEYRGVCTGIAERKFLLGYNLGKAKTKVSLLKKDIAHMKQENAKLEEQIKSARRENFRLKSSNFSLRRELRKME